MAAGDGTRAQPPIARRRLAGRRMDVGERIRDALGDEVDPEELARLDGAVRAALRAPSADAQRELVVGGFAAHGLRYSTYVNVLAQLDPEAYQALRGRVGEVIERWARGWRATDRADDDEARARYFLDGLAMAPGLSRIAAGAVANLPPGHPLRDEDRIRRSLENILEQAVEAAATENADESTLEGQTEYALLALAGLIEHELVPPLRIDSLLEAGRRLLESPHLSDGRGGEQFRQAAARHLLGRAEEADRRGEGQVAEGHRAEAAALLSPWADSETDALRKQLLTLLVHHASGNSPEVADMAETLSTLPAGDRREQGVALVGARVAARSALREGDHDKVIATLTPILPVLEDRYLSSVLDRDVATTGQALAEAAATLASAQAHAGDFGAAAATVDRAKSLRFRYQALLRASPDGESIRRLEADIHAVARGVLPASRAPATLDALLEEYRQARARLSPDALARPGVADVARVLADDEAVAVLAVSAAGLLLIVIRAGDDRQPALGEVIPREEENRLLQAMIDPGTGWMVALGTSLADRRGSLLPLLTTADGILGRRLAAALGGTGVRRLTVIPHTHLHLVPWWLLPALAPYAVMTASSAGQFVADRRRRGTTEPSALVVANPTGDLPVSTIEAAHVAGSLRSVGWPVDVLAGPEATEQRLADGVATRGILHFAGHARSDPTNAVRSALEVHPDPSATILGEKLTALADAAPWKDVHRLAGTEWVEVPTERQADLPEHGHLEERLRLSEQRAELRLEHGATGTLLGQYTFDDVSDDDRTVYGERIRLAELWSAGDILVEHRFRDCGLVFLSSCEAGLGQLGEVDEFAGLPAALQLAGASAVVSSLWPVAEETAAVFADLFYGALVGAGPTVDLLELVQAARHRLRLMDRSEAAAILSRIRAEARDPVTRFRLEARIAALDDHPFSHPYEWGAFHLTGTPELELVPGPGETPASAALRREARPEEFALPVPEVEPVVDPEAGRDSRDPDALADAGEALARLTGDPAVQQMAAGFVHDRAMSRARAGDEAGAARDLQRALELDPGHVPARVALARSSLQHGDAASAIGHLDVVTAAEPDHRDARWLRGLARERLGDAEGALDDFEVVVRAGRDDALAFEAFRAEGRALVAVDKEQAAVEALDQAIKLRPEAADAYVSRGLIRLGLDRWEEALADAQRGAFLDPGSAAALGLRRVARAAIHVDRGLARAAMRHYDDAIADYEEALRLEPGNVPARFNRACAYSRMQVAGTIVDDLRAAFEARPELRDHARADDDLEWARTHLAAVQNLLREQP